MIKTFAVVALLACASCGLVPQPTPAQMMAADIGPQPDRNAAIQFSEATARKFLLDPDSAHFTWGPKILRDYYHVGNWSATPHIAWKLMGSVIAKKENGDFAPSCPWTFWFRDGHMVAVESWMVQPGAATVELSPPAPFPPGWEAR